MNIRDYAELIELMDKKGNIEGPIDAEGLANIIYFFMKQKGDITPSTQRSLLHHIKQILISKYKYSMTDVHKCFSYLSRLTAHMRLKDNG